MRLLFGLFLLDSSFPHNATLISTLKKEATGAGLYEAFLESAPQFILQCAIILSSGNISEYPDVRDGHNVTNYENFESFYDITWVKPELSSKLQPNATAVTILRFYGKSDILTLTDCQQYNGDYFGLLLPGLVVTEFRPAGGL